MCSMRLLHSARDVPRFKLNQNESVCGLGYRVPLLQHWNGKLLNGSLRGDEQWF
jgi:hypothetical protein